MACAALSAEVVTSRSVADPLPEAVTEAVHTSFAYADSIVRFRWSEVCALSGALLVRGTVDGTQLSHLIRMHRQAVRAMAGKGDDHSAHPAETAVPQPSELGSQRHGSHPSVSSELSSEPGVGTPPHERLLERVAHFPFLFGCVYAAMHWPPRDPRLAGPGENA